MALEKITPGRYRMRNGKAVQVDYVVGKTACAVDRGWWADTGRIDRSYESSSDLVARLPDYPVYVTVGRGDVRHFLRFDAPATPLSIAVGLSQVAFMVDARVADLEVFGYGETSRPHGWADLAGLIAAEPLAHEGLGPRSTDTAPLKNTKQFQRIGFATEPIGTGDLLELNSATGEVRRMTTGGATNGTN